MNKTLQLIFRNAQDRNVTVSVADPLDELEVNDVEAVMQLVVDGNMFHTTGGDIVAKVRAQVVSRDVETIVEF